jgi:hypothetical protein
MTRKRGRAGSKREDEAAEIQDSGEWQSGPLAASRDGLTLAAWT